MVPVPVPTFEKVPVPVGFQLHIYSGREKFMPRGKFMPQHFQELFLVLKIDLGT
jgi:hypothetical protein